MSCLCVQLLLYLLNCLYLNPLILSLLPFQFAPSSHCREMSKWLQGTELPAGVNPEHWVIHLSSYASSVFLVVFFLSPNQAFCMCAGILRILNEYAPIKAGYGFKTNVLSLCGMREWVSKSFKNELPTHFLEVRT